MTNPSLIGGPLAVAWALTALLLSGCSMQRLAYNNADWLLLQELDSYLDLTDGQQSRTEAALAVAHRRHRQSVLPEAADALADAAARVRRGLTEPDVREVMDTARTLLASTLAEVLPTVSAALSELSGEQRSHLEARLAKRNQDYAERHWLDLSRAERLERRAARTVSRIEEWTGPLSAEQSALVHTLRSEMPDNAADWLTHTRARQQALMTLIARGSPASAVERFLHDWWLFRDDLPAELSAVRERQTEGFVRLIARLAATLDSVQRSHLANRLDALARDARELAVSA